jgi:hypothetical protein
MKPVIRYQSQLLFRKSYKPNRVIRIRPTGKRNLVFRPSQADCSRVIMNAKTQTATEPNVAFSG